MKESYRSTIIKTLVWRVIATSITIFSGWFISGNWKFGLAVGEAIDITTGWDLMKTGERRRCMQWIRQNKPEVIVVSPPRTAFSKLQSLNIWSEKQARAFWIGSKLLKFAAEIAKEQAQDGRHFIFEHPASAASWKRKEIKA